MMRAGMCMAFTLAALGAGWAAAPASAQDNPNPEQMKKMYDDALKQLKASQERKNELAAENEKLKQQIDALTKDLAGARGELQMLRQTDAAYAERTFFLRSHYMAWQAFAKANPETALRWRVFLESTYLLTPDGGPTLIDRTWPAAVGDVAATQPATLPTTVPTTVPAPTTQTTTAPSATLPAATQASTAPATVPTVPATTAPAPAQPVVPPTTRPATKP